MIIQENKCWTENCELKCWTHNVLFLPNFSGAQLIIQALSLYLQSSWICWLVSEVLKVPEFGRKTPPRTPFEGAHLDKEHQPRPYCPKASCHFANSVRICWVHLETFFWNVKAQPYGRTNLIRLFRRDDLKIRRADPAVICLIKKIDALKPRSAPATTEFSEPV